MPQTSGKAPYGIVIAGQIRPGAALAVRGHAKTIADAHRSAQNGNKFWTYATVVGAGNRFFVFAPFQDHSALGNFSHGQALSSAGNVDSLLSDLESNLEGTQRSIVEYLPEFSNHPTGEGDAPGPYLYVVALKIAPGKTARAKELAGQVTAAHKQGGLQYWVYSTSVGTGGEVYAVIPFKSFADIDSWSSAGGSLGGSADDVLSELESLISESQRMILEYVPDCSNPA